MLWLVYNLLFPIVFLFMLPKFIARMLKRGGYGQHFEQRIGRFGHNTRARLKAYPRIWVHAVSVGEIYVALRFMKAWREAHPEARFALSTTTSTGHAIGRREIDDRDVLFYFPVDLPVIISKVLRIVNPARIVLVEGEFWPNLIRLADRRGVPVSLINGRMSLSSFKGYSRLASFTRDILQRLDTVCVQGEKDAQRLIHLGARPERVHVMGTVKFDVAERDPEGDRMAADVLRRAGVPPNAAVVLGGSTWPGEEEILCRIYKTLKTRFEHLFLILVPRHVERADEIVACLEAQGLTYVRRSQLNDEPGSCPDVLFVDTTGELRHFYSVASLIFVGKSLTQHGGQNPIEPALYGKAILTGPNMENFPAVMASFHADESLVQVADSEELQRTIEQLLADDAARKALGGRAQQTVQRNRGVIERTVHEMEEE